MEDVGALLRTSEANNEKKSRKHLLDMYYIVAHRNTHTNTTHTHTPHTHTHTHTHAHTVWCVCACTIHTYTQAK